MANSLPWSVKGVDARTRDAAKTAARRAGMTLGEWLDHKIRLEAAADAGAAPFEDEPEQLDIGALSERLARLASSDMESSQKANAATRRDVAETPRRDVEQMIAQAAALERQTRESTSKTAGALESIARWMERTEGRISAGERAAAERQERATTVIADAIKTMGERLNQIERHADPPRSQAEAPRPQSAPRSEAAPRPMPLSRERFAAAVTDIRSRQRALDVEGAARPQPAPRPAFVREEPRADAPPPGSERSGLDTEALAGMISALGARIERLDRADRFEPIARPLAQLDASLRRLDRDDRLQPVLGPLGRIEANVARLDRGDRLDPVLKPLARVEAELARLAERKDDAGLERFQLEIGHLAAKVDALIARGGDRSMLAPVLNDIADLRDLVQAQGAERQLDDLGGQVASLSAEIARLRDGQSDGHEIRGIALAIEDVREAIRQDRARSIDPAMLGGLSRQVEALASRFDALPSMQAEALNGQADALFERLGAMVSRGSAPSEALTRHIERLARGLEDLAEHTPARIGERIDALQRHIEQIVAHGPAEIGRQIEGLAHRIEALAQVPRPAAAAAPVDLGPVEDMLRALALKIDDVGRPGADSESFDALEQQIAGLAHRLDAAAATRSAESGMERTLQDLVRHLQTVREDTAVAAERAARAAMADTAHQAPSTGFAELSSIVSGLHESQASHGRETQDAIGAMHRALDNVLDRLAGIEAEITAERRAARQQPQPQPAPPRAAQGLSLPEKLRAPEQAADSELAPGASARVLRAERSAPASAEDEISAALDLPLEPGTGRPRLDKAGPGGTQDAQSIRQSLIAAARRSAKAATEAAEPQAAIAEAAKPAGRLKEILDKRRKPLLLGLAAVVLAMGTAHVVTGALKGNPGAKAPLEAPKTPAAERDGVQADAPPVKDQSSMNDPAPQAPAVSRTEPAQKAEAAPEAPAAPSMAAATGIVSPANASAPATAVTMPSLPAAAPPSADTLQAATGIGELPATLGTAAMRKAALGGDARAVYELANRAAEGSGAQRDPKLALKLFERAAVAGLAPAQFRLGNLFEKGTGTQRDPALARLWYQRAAERGNAKAMHNLAVLHAEGVAGKPDYATATGWFRKAAEFGVRDSQYNLAILLGRGLGAPADLGQSYLWFAVAAAQGDEDGARKRDEVAQRLAAPDLAAAKAAVAAWKPKPLDAEANEVAAPAKGWDETPSAATKKPARPGRG